jgi:hypothetical protein
MIQIGDQMSVRTMNMTYSILLVQNECGVVSGSKIAGETVPMTEDGS